MVKKILLFPLLLIMGVSTIANALTCPPETTVGIALQSATQKQLYGQELIIISDGTYTDFSDGWYLIPVGRIQQDEFRSPIFGAVHIPITGGMGGGAVTCSYQPGLTQRGTGGIATSSMSLPAFLILQSVVEGVPYKPVSGNWITTFCVGSSAVSCIFTK